MSALGIEGRRGPAVLMQAELDPRCMCREDTGWWYESFRSLPLCVLGRGADLDDETIIPKVKTMLHTGVGPSYI